MRNTLLLLSFMLCTSLFANGVESFVETESSVEEVCVEVKHGTLRVDGGEGRLVEIYDITGKKVASYSIESASESIELNLSKGVYVVRVGKVVRKVHLS